jgi:hypothetical protein
MVDDPNKLKTNLFDGEQFDAAVQRVLAAINN